MPFLRAKRRNNLPSYRVERIVTLRFSTTDRIAAGITPTIEKLLANDKYGETYRCAVAHLHRTAEPPLAYYLGRSSLCRIYGPLQEASSDLPSSGYLPVGGLIETPGQTIRLSPIEANTIQNRIQSAIEREILGWVRESEDRQQLRQREVQGATREAVTALGGSGHDA